MSSHKHISVSTSKHSVVVMVDTDHILLSGYNNLSSVISGVGIAASYDLGQTWIEEWAIPFCDGKCDILEDDYDRSYGAETRQSVE
jgi:hypothetical protein